MRKRDIAALVGRTHFNFTHHRNRGVIPNYPEGYKTMSAEELLPYALECKRLIEANNRTAYARRVESRRKNKANFELPKYLQGKK